MSSNSSGDGRDDARLRLKAAFMAPPPPADAEPGRRIHLPPVAGSLSQTVGQGETLRVDGTNVIRVPFGMRQSRRAKPQRPDHWATVVLPFQLGGSPPPQAA